MVHFKNFYPRLIPGLVLGPGFNTPPPLSRLQSNEQQQQQILSNPTLAPGPITTTAPQIAAAKEVKKRKPRTPKKQEPAQVVTLEGISNQPAVTPPGNLFSSNKTPRNVCYRSELC